MSPAAAAAPEPTTLENLEGKVRTILHNVESKFQHIFGENIEEEIVAEVIKEVKDLIAKPEATAEAAGTPATEPSAPTS